MSQTQKYINSKPKHIRDQIIKIREKKTKIFVVMGGQAGDEAKGNETDKTIKILLDYASKNHLIPEKSEKETTIFGAGFLDDNGEEVKFDLKCTNVDKESYQIICCRCNGSSNAGHTIVKTDAMGKKKKYDTHLLPSGIVSEGVMNVIGANVLVNMKALMKEIHKINKMGITDIADRLLIAYNSPVTLRIHCDKDSTEKSRIGSTGNGVGPSAGDKAERYEVRMVHLIGDNYEEKIRNLYNHHLYRYNNQEELIRWQQMLDEDLQLVRTNQEFFKKVVCDVGAYLTKRKEDARSRFCVEFANAFLLDPNAGISPYTTSTICTIGAIYDGLCVSPACFSVEEMSIVAVSKAYMTRVGKGPFITKQNITVPPDWIKMTNEEKEKFWELVPDHGLHSKEEIYWAKIAAKIQDFGHEYGTTTGRLRDVGWLDIVILVKGIQYNGYQSINLSKSDVLQVLGENDKVKVCVAYKYKSGRNDGKVLDHYPLSEDEWGIIEPVYKEVEGWSGIDISNCKTWDELPTGLKQLVELIEHETNIPVSSINTGADSESVIYLF